MILLLYQNFKEKCSGMADAAVLTEDYTAYLVKIHKRRKKAPATENVAVHMEHDKQAQKGKSIK
jgi:hypothetical protein